MILNFLCFEQNLISYLIDFSLRSIPLNNNNNTQETTDGCSTPPVFRHLNAEFRQQLKLKDKRSPESTKTTITTTATLTISTTTNNSTDSQELVTLESVETNGVAIPDDGHKFLKVRIKLHLFFS